MTDAEDPQDVELTSSPTRRVAERDEDTPQDRSFPPTGPTPTPESLHPGWVAAAIATATAILLAAYLLSLI